MAFSEPVEDLALSRLRVRLDEAESHIRWLLVLVDGDDVLRSSAFAQAARVFLSDQI